jgi:uncharacterized membrane protein
MNKFDFLLKLEDALSGLPNEEIRERISFYGEMIDDKIEDGKTEQQAVAEIGSVEEIAEQILKDIPLTKIVKQKIKPKKKLSAAAITLICAGSPVWFPVLISVFAVVFSLYLCLWAIIICLYAVCVACFGLAVGSLFMAVGEITNGKVFEGIALIGAALLLIGLGILLFIFSNLAAKGVLILTKKLALAIKKLLIKKEEAK